MKRATILLMVAAAFVLAACDNSGSTGYCNGQNPPSWCKLFSHH